MKRQRGRGRKPGGGGGHHNHGGHHQPNRTMESNGPDTKVRGPASHIFERYLQLARDAASSGDRVLSENYLQHADHYFRLVRSMQPATPPPQQNADRFGEALDDDLDGGAEGEGEEAEAAASGDQPDADFPQGQQQQFEQREGAGEGGRRRRGRRNRYRGNEGEEGDSEGGEAREGGEGEQRAERAPREERPRREPRPPRDRDDDQSGPEGFSSGPKPAFLRD